MSGSGGVPKGWCKTPLSNFVENYKGGAALTPQDFSVSGFEVIPKKAIGETGTLNLSKNATYCSEAFAIQNRRSIVNSEYLITTLRDLVPTGPSIGRIVMFNGVDEYLLAQGVYGFKLKGLLDARFLIAVSNSPFFRKLMTTLAVGSTQIHIRTHDFFDVEILLPPLEEQRKIAAILSTWDETIERQTWLLEMKREHKRGLMQQLLTGQVRFREFEGLEWKRATLNECATCLDNRRIPLNSEERSLRAGNVPYWGANGVVDYIDTHIFDETLVLLAEDGGYFGDYLSRPIANMSYGKAWVNNHAHVLKAKENATNEWIYYSLVHKNILAYVNSGTRSKLNKNDMLAISIDLPSIYEQQKIASVLSTADAELEILKTQLAALKEQKRGLMQQLLTGKTRVTGA